MTKNANYVGRIERALSRLEKAQDGDRWPGLAELADAAALSEFHFHRIDRLMTGETPQETLTRVRLGGSLPALLDTDGICGATASSGYATSQSYARALKALTGATPSQLRDDPDLFAEVSEALLRPRVADQSAAPVSVEIADTSPLRLVAVRKTGDFSNLNEGYHRLFELLMQDIAPEQVTGLYGVPHSDPRFTDAADCYFDCAVSTSANVSEKAGLHFVDVPGGPALRLRIGGDYDAVHAALDDLYRLAIVLDLPLDASLPLNYYHHDPEEVPEDQLVADVFLMLEE